MRIYHHKKVLYVEKPTADILYHLIMRKKSQRIFTEVKMKWACPLFPVLLTIGKKKQLGRSIRQERQIKGIPMGKKEVRVYLFADNMILYINNTENSTRKLF